MAGNRIPAPPPAPQGRHLALIRGDAALWLVAGGAYVLALLLSTRELAQDPGALRTPGVLAVGALLAAMVSVPWVAGRADGPGWPDYGLCLAYGLWAAAAFRLVPPIGNEQVLFARNLFSADAPYVLLGAAVHGALAILLTWPIACRLLGPDGRGARDERLWELGAVTVLLLFVVAAVVRVMAGL
jgi:hypothetical protein